MTSRLSFCFFRKAGRRFGFRSARVTRYTTGERSKSNAQAEPCSPAPSTSMRTAIYASDDGWEIKPLLRNSKIAISGGTKTRNGTPTTPIPRLTYN